MTPRFGIDTSVLVRLLTGSPELDFLRCVRQLESLVDDGAEVFASNQVIGEAYIAVQHHYGIGRATVRSGMLDVLQSGLVQPLNGRAVFAMLESTTGPGLLDRLIADDYSRADMETLTLDRKMASALPMATLIKDSGG